MKDKIVKHLNDGIAVRQATVEACAESIEQAARLMAAAIGKSHCIYLFGNGGSAADAQHIEAELTGRYLKERSAWNVRALTANTSAITAIGNDYGFDEIFARQLQFSVVGDLAFGISTSGKSANVLKGLQEARSHGAKTIGLCGEDSSVMAPLCDVCIAVPSAFTPYIQEMHISVGHILCQLIEDQVE